MQISRFLFREEFLTSVNRNKKGLLNGETGIFPLDEILIREDGSIVLIGEKQTVSSDRATATATWEYYDIAIINFDINYKMTWTKFINKYQTGVTPANLSYYTFLKDDIVYLIYNIGGKDVTEKSLKSNNSIGSGYAAAMVSINRNGDFTKNYLFSTQEEDVIIFPSICRKINKDTILIYADKGNKYKFGVLNFE